MTVFALASQLLTLFSPEERTIPDDPQYPGRNGAVLLAMNGAMQVIHGKESPWVRNDDRGAILHAPAASVPIIVTNDSRVASMAAGDWKTWFSGCPIQIAGATVENQIRNNSRDILLKFPHDGPTGTTTATVRQVSIDLDADVIAPTGRVLLNKVQVFPWATPRDQVARSDDYGFANSSRYLAGSGPPVNPSVGYRVETWCPSPTAAPAYRMIFEGQPAPGFVEYSAMTVPMVITDLASLETLPIPLQYVQSIFYPIARQLLTGCEFYRGGGSAEEIGRSYQAALKSLADLTPETQTGTRIIALM